MFNSLDKDHIQRILKPIFDAISKRLKDQHEIILKIDSEVVEMLVDKGYKPEFGARELRRAVERLLEGKLAEKLLGNGSDKSEWNIILKSDEVVVEVGRIQ